VRQGAFVSWDDPDVVYVGPDTVEYFETRLGLAIPRFRLPSAPEREHSGSYYSDVDGRSVLDYGYGRREPKWSAIRITYQWYAKGIPIELPPLVRDEEAEPGVRRWDEPEEFLPGIWLLRTNPESRTQYHAPWYVLILRFESERLEVIISFGGTTRSEEALKVAAIECFEEYMSRICD